MPASQGMIEYARNIEARLIASYATAPSERAKEIEKVRYQLCARRLIATMPPELLIPGVTAGMTLSAEELTDDHFYGVVYQALALMPDTDMALGVEPWLVSKKG